jgi:O-antigen ligase
MSSVLYKPMRPAMTAVSGGKSGSGVVNDPTALPSRFALRLLGFYVFLLVSRVLDLSPIWWLHIPLIALVVLVLTTILRTGVRFALESKISRYFGLFTLWVVFCYPLSSWRSASEPLVIGSVEFYLVFLIIVQVVRTAEQWRIVAGGYAYAVLVAAVYGFIYARNIDGRLALVGGTFGDPNGFALSLLIGIPFLWVKAAYANSFRKIFFLACSVVVFISFAKAGSRGGLLALAVMVAVMFILSNAKQRILICVAASIGLVAAATLLPDYLRARYFTFFTPAAATLDSNSREQLESDIASADERQALLQQSIKMSFEHPIFGVGPGVFAFAAWDERKAETGVGGLTLVSHNTYTQISSETGFPGLIFFLGAVFFCLKYTLVDYRAMARAGSDIAKLSRGLLLAFVALLVGIFFLSTAYSQFIALLIALAASLHNVVEQERLSGGASHMAQLATTRERLAPAKLSKQVQPARPVRVRPRVPSYLRSRGLSKSTAVEDPQERP